MERKARVSRHPPTAPQSRRECMHSDRPKESWRVSREGTPEFFPRWIHGIRATIDYRRRILTIRAMIGSYREDRAHIRLL
ncbi:hypothetical protein BIFDEN_00229 [Bifidobacterium dentium ATCC 27678]|nr:hypothetical protein BIFDEN_00229 [Bifidobacterium dentium ATCC 27678]